MHNGLTQPDGAIETLKREIYNNLFHHDKRINDLIEKMWALPPEEFSEGIYENLAGMAKKAEELICGLRDSMTNFYNECQALGYQPGALPVPAAPNVRIEAGEKRIRIVCDGMLPFPINGSVHYLHEQLDAALERFIRENRLPRPFFPERCAVVFLHHYGSTKGELRHLRDYDNLERRCVTNVIASHFLWSDSPKHIVSMDILVPGNSNYTEILMMTVPEFKDFIAAGNMEYVP